MALLDVESAVAAPPTSSEVAWFTTEKNGIRCVYFAEKGGQNGQIDPAFILAAYVLEAKPEKVAATNYYYIFANYVVDEKWKTAHTGISRLADAQQAEDKIVIAALQDNSASKFSGTTFTKVGIGLGLNALKLVTPCKTVDDIFVPRTSAFGHPDSAPLLIGSPDWGTHTIPRLYMMAAVILEQSRKASVVCLIVNKQGVIVGCGTKSHSEGGCSHAEVKAIFSLRGELPDGGAIFGTLKPCTMCAGLLHAVDPNGRFRKYWVRDDNNKAADWSRIGTNFRLTGGFKLDKGCENVKYLKVDSGGGSFFERFTGVRDNSSLRAAEKKGTEEDEAEWYSVWARNYQFPNSGVWANLGYRSEGEFQRGARIAKKALIDETVDGKMSLASFINDHLGIATPGKGKGFTGLNADLTKTIKDSYQKLRSDRLERAYPAQVIKIICWNSASVALQNSARNAFKAKLEKYENSDDLNPYVRDVLNYLSGSLKEMNVSI